MLYLRHIPGTGIGTCRSEAARQWKICRQWLIGEMRGIADQSISPRLLDIPLGPIAHSGADSPCREGRDGILQDGQHALGRARIHEAGVEIEI